MVIVEEEQYVKLISLIIDAEISYAINQGDIDTGSTSLFSRDHHINVIRQSAHTYHAIYCGVLDEVVIKQTGDSSLSGRLGIITWYIPSNRWV